MDFSNDIDNVTLYVQDPDDSGYDYSKIMNAETANENYTFTFNKNDDAATHGDYDLRAVVYESNSDSTSQAEKTITMDSQPPSIIFPDEYVQDDPTISLDVSDEYTGVESISASADNDAEVEDVEDGQCDTGDECTVDVDVDTGSLDSGDNFDLTVDSTDQVGNEGTDSQTFTFDTEYDGDTNPSISVEDEDNGVVNFDEDKDMDVDFDSADSESDTTATCFVEDENVGSGSFSSAESGTDEVTCDIDLDDDMDYYDTEAEVYVEMEDEAGNSETSDSENIAFDVNAPYVSMDSVAGVSTFNDNFDMELSVSDSATSVDYIEYFFDDAGTNYEDGTDISDFEDGEFEVDASGLDSGDHTLYVRAEDEAGHWSDPSSFDFEYLPNQDPEISLSVPESVSVEAGSSDSFEVELENTGEFFIEELPVDVSSDVYSESDSVADFEPGDSVTLSFDVEPAEDDIGEYDMEVSTSSPSVSETFTYRVRANEQQREDIQSRVDEQVERLEEVEANVTELQEKVSGEREERLNSNFSEFKSDVEEAQEAVENGEYYRAESLMEDIDDRYTATQDSYEKVEKEYRSSQRFKLILGFLAIIVLGGIGGIGFLVYEGRIDPEELKAELQGMTGGIDTGSIGGANIVMNVKSMFNSSESEAEEFEWDGFKD